MIEREVKVFESTCRRRSIRPCYLCECKREKYFLSVRVVWSELSTNTFKSAMLMKTQL